MTPVARYWNGSAWVDFAGAVETLRVTSLPGSPVNGQEIYYVADATAGVIWHFRYNAGSASAYKWEFVGGPPLYAFGAGNTSGTMNSTTFQTAATPSITVPLVGDYDVGFGSPLVQTWASTLNEMHVGLHQGGVLGRVTSVIQTQVWGGAAVAAHERLTAVPASTALNPRYRSGSGNNSAFHGVWLTVQPVRVG